MRYLLSNLHILIDGGSKVDAGILQWEIKQNLVKSIKRRANRTDVPYPVPSIDLLNGIDVYREGHNWCVGIRNLSPLYSRVMNCEFGVKGNDRVVRPVLEDIIRRKE